MQSVLLVVLILIEVVCCLLLIGVILLQQSKSQGLGLAFGGGMGESLFGSRAGNVLTKITIILSIVFLANTTLLGILFSSSDDRSLVEKVAAPAPLPVAAPAASDMMASPSQQGTLFPTTDGTPVTAPVEAPAMAPTVTADPIPIAVPAEEAASPVETAEPVATP
ncbi:MAG TPA: preprotein translocase subunit SecG [Kiritimatiellia bacterium]|mgnify:FL=1|nr:preprotein translocase subunit SecG [Kiritimatiellia bacterium]HMP34611.1 preprotein translocase subunit SecG [Kiritimatiellia bacterium]